MPSPQAIAQSQERLATHRATLAIRLTQQAALGSAHAPPEVAHDIREARTAIAQLKATLRGWGVSVEDLPDDEDVRVLPQPVPPLSPRPPEHAVLPEPTRRLKVFLCHASDDKLAVRQLYQRLREAGVTPWLDAEDLVAGRRWQVAISKAVRDSDVVLVCLSQRSVTKAGYVQQELAFALNVAAQQSEEAIYLIPLRLEDCTAPEQLRDRHWVDLFADDGFQRLLRALQVRAAEVGALPLVVQPQPPTVDPPPPSPPPKSSVEPHPVISPADKPTATVKNRSWAGVVGFLLTVVVVSLLGLTWLRRGPVPTPLPAWVPELVKVPAGPFLMGSTDQQIAAAVSQGASADWVKYEKPQHTLTLPDYWIGKTEVTNAQFLPFVEGDGYTNPAYWTTAGWAWRQAQKITQPGCWDEAGRNGDTQPVVCVSWFEAVAYCRWLSKQTGIEFRLPSEAEWEKAARGSDGWIYPWGNTWDASVVNSRESNLQQTTPVGSYPKGASPYGAMDMAGNVWEWCATQWGKPYPYQLEDEWQPAYVEADQNRVVRGGSSWNDSTYVRGASRFYFYPRARDFSKGLRVASHSLVPGSGF